MKLKLKCAIALMLVFIQTSNIMASGVLNPTAKKYAWFK